MEAVEREKSTWFCSLCNIEKKKKISTSGDKKHMNYEMLKRTVWVKRSMVLLSRSCKAEKAGWKMNMKEKKSLTASLGVGGEWAQWKCLGNRFGLIFVKSMFACQGYAHVCCLFIFDKLWWCKDLIILGKISFIHYVSDYKRNLKCLIN